MSKGLSKIASIFLSVMIIFSNAAPAIALDSKAAETREEQTVTEEIKEDTSNTDASEKDDQTDVLQGKDAEEDSETEQSEETDDAESASETEHVNSPFFAEQTINDMTLRVEAEEGVFPEGCTLSIRKIDKKKEQALITEAVKTEKEDQKIQNNVTESFSYDIKVLDAEENEVQPEGDVNVSIVSDLVKNKNLDTTVYHISEETVTDKKTGEEETVLSAAILDESEDETAKDEYKVISDGFSYYTVEFTYNDLTYVMDGDTEIPIKNILDYVGLEGTVTTVEGSNDKLFSFEQRKGEWYVKANKAFHTEEWMEVVIDDIRYRIKVTDDDSTNQAVSYTGSYKKWTCPKTGTYAIELYGAQGGTTQTGTASGTMGFTSKSAHGGYGGYAYGEVELTAGDELYIAVGGQGEEGKLYLGQEPPVSRTHAAGGWNGGGQGGLGADHPTSGLLKNAENMMDGGGGGGATAVYTSLIGDGQLKNYNNNKSSILMVAGGGGGSVGSIDSDNSLLSLFGSDPEPGGNGGGTTGGNGSTSAATGGTQTSGHAFGTGQPVTTQKTSYSYGRAAGNGGGGGGYYGGKANTSTDENSNSSGAGGSGYIGSSVSNGYTLTSNHTGAGSFRINLISNTDSLVTYNANGGTVSPTSVRVAEGESIGVFPTPTRSNLTFDGWYTAAKGGTKVTAPYTPAAKSKIILYAHWSYTKSLSYTGAYQTWTPPVDGTYKLEIYGGQGGINPDGRENDKPGTESAGGYTYGNIYRATSQPLYVAVGGEGGDGSRNTGGTGGWNGGGNGGKNASTNAISIASVYGGGGGGGATAVYTVLRGSGLLTSYSSYKSNILMVAGGGGGNWGAEVSNIKSFHYGGKGGGTSGGTEDQGVYTGGTQTSGYAFGQGQDAADKTSVSSFTLVAGARAGNGGGGGGYYGGKASQVTKATSDDNTKTGGGGGSGYTSSSLSNASTSTSSHTGNGSFKATLVSIDYELTFDPNGGDCDTLYKAVTKGNSSGALPTATRSGYTMLGWYTAASGGTKRADAGGSYTPTTSETLYAHWAKNVTISFDPNGGETEAESINSYVGASSGALPAAIKTDTNTTYDVTFVFNDGSTSDLTIPFEVNETFNATGWYTAATGGTKRANVGSSYTLSISEQLYAQYNSTPDSVDVESKTLPTPTRSGYIFNGWGTSSTQTTAGLTGTYSPTASTTLFALWEKDPNAAPTVSVKAVIHWNDNKTGTAAANRPYPVVCCQKTEQTAGTNSLNGLFSILNVFAAGTIASSSDDETLWQKTNDSSWSYTFEMEGESTDTFDVWIESYPEGYKNSAVGQEKSNVAANGTLSTGLTLNAAYSVTYNATTGNNAPAAQEKEAGVDLTLSSDKPTRVGYHFSSWNTASDGSGTSYAPGATYTADADIVLYAQWKEVFAEFDSPTGKLRFFEDSEGKYTNGQTSGTKTYYTDIERNYNWVTNELEEDDIPWHSVRANITTVDFECNVKPSTTGIGYWFSNMTNLETVSNAGRLDLSQSLNAVYTFENCSSLTGIDVSGWDMSTVTNTSSMFEGCEALTTLNVSNWDISSLENAALMFKGCKNLQTLNVSGWDTSSLKRTNLMFQNCTVLNGLNTSGWILGNAELTNNMFQNCKALTSLDTSTWDLSNDKNMSYMFAGCEALTSIGDTSDWNTGNCENTPGMFQDCKVLRSLNTSGWDLSKVTHTYSMFQRCYVLSGLDVSNWGLGSNTWASSMFNDCRALTTLNVANWDTKNILNMNWMFQGCSNLETLNVGSWNVAKVQGLRQTFHGCEKITTLNVSNWNTGAVTNMNATFQNCYLLETLDVSNWDTSKVTDFQSTFKECIKLGTLDVSDWNTGAATTMASMFYDVRADVIDVSGFDTADVTDMNTMFYNCKNAEVIDVSGFNTSSVTNLQSMFNDCESVKLLDFHNWNTGNVTNMSGMFNKCNSVEEFGVGSNSIFTADLPQTKWIRYKALDNTPITEGTKIANISNYTGTDTGWYVHYYDVTYDANGGTNAPAAQSKNAKTDLALRSETPTREGYRFTGWNTLQNGNGASYASGGTYGTNSDMILYAQWEDVVPIPSGLNKTGKAFMIMAGIAAMLAAAVVRTRRKI